MGNDPLYDRCMQMTPIDHGFMRISRADALKLGNGTLPDHGRERLVVHEGQHYWLTRTPVYNEMVWSVRKTDWRLVNGVAVLGGVR